MAGRSRIDVLLNLVPDNPSSVLQHLTNDPTLAGSQDMHGYSLLHAAVSYSHADLVRTLVERYEVSPNISDEDNETPLFYAENIEIATLMLELGADLRQKNSDGQTAAVKIADDEDFPQVAAFLRQKAAALSGEAATNGALSNGTSEQLMNAPPPVPAGVDVRFGTMNEPEGEAPDPEFRRRIEELAARDDFQGEEGQRELRNLVTEAVSGMREDAGGDGRAAIRRRLDD